MEWLVPAGAWAFGSIVVVLALYILRRRAKEIEVPSLLLWQKTDSSQEASRPFQRLRRQWLLILQLLLAVLLSLALMRPALIGGMHGEIVFIFDVSASMQAEVNGVSRIREAVEDAQGLVDGMQDGDAVTILTAGSSVGQVLARSSDKQKIKSLLSRLEAENGTADMDGAVSLAQAMRRDMPELSIVIYTDSYVSKGEGAEVRIVGKAADNRSVLSLQCSEQQDGLTAFARIANYGADAEVAVECYADGVLCDIRTLPLVQGEEQSVQFVVPMEAQSVWVQLATPDALAADDVRYWVAQEKTQWRVLLVTEGNVFMEKVLALREDVQVFRATAEDAQNADGFDLYVLDGGAAAALPENGAILAIAPTDEVEGIQMGALVENTGNLRAQSGALAQAMVQNTLLSDIALRAIGPLTGGQSILTSGEHTVMAVNEQAGRRAAVLGFALRDSNLPVKADFPILMRNVLDYLLPEAVGAVESTVCGQAVPVVLDERTTSAQIVTPRGRMVDVNGRVFQDTGEIGIYALREERTDVAPRTTLFTLHIPASESDLRQETVSVQEETASRQERKGAGREITVWVLAGVLLLLLVEWEVSRRGA